MTTPTSPAARPRPAAATLAAATVAPARRLLVCYLPVGDPEAGAASAVRYAEHGVDVIESGLAVLDPALDGPEVRASMRRAVAAGVHGPAGARCLAEQLAGAGGPAAIWMSYRPDPDDRYLELVASAGVGGILLPDADPAELAARAAAHGLHAVPFLDHDPCADQLTVAREARSYVMLAAAPGVTGARPAVDEDNRDVLAAVRAQGVTAPVVLGFGISGAEHARVAVGLGADGVVVGSACVRAARAGAAELDRLLTGLRRALDD